MSFRETAVVVFDGGGAVVYQTPAAAALLGVSADCRVQRLFRHASGPIDSEAGPLRVRRVPLRPSSLFGRYRAQTGGLGAAVTGNGRNGAVGCNGARCPQIIVLEPLRHRHDLMTRLRQHGFSQREIEVAAAVLRGRNNPTIAKACAIDPATVKVHLRNIYEKVGVHSRAELTARILGFDSGWGWALQRPVTPKKTGPLPL